MSYTSDPLLPSQLCLHAKINKQNHLKFTTFPAPVFPGPAYLSYFSCDHFLVNFQHLLYLRESSPGRSCSTISHQPGGAVSPRIPHYTWTPQMASQVSSLVRYPGLEFPAVLSLEPPICGPSAIGTDPLSLQISHSLTLLDQTESSRIESSSLRTQHPK